MHPKELIKKQDPKLNDCINDIRELAFEEGKISKKHKFLIALGIDAALRAEKGVVSLTRQALENGATREEINETLRIVNYICGVSASYAAADALKDIL